MEIKRVNDCKKLKNTYIRLKYKQVNISGDSAPVSRDSAYKACSEQAVSTPGKVKKLYI